MQKKAEIEAKLARVLNGGTNPLDLNDIMTFMRVRSHGIMPVREAGDLLAHFDRRDQKELQKHSAILARLIRSLIEAAETKALGIEKHGQSLVERVMLHSEREVKEATGLSRKKCVERMSAALRNKRSDPDTFKLFQHFANSYPIFPLMNSTQIIEGLRSALKKEHLLATNEQSRLFTKIAPLFVLHLITRAHLCETFIGDDDIGTIRAAVDKGLLQLHAAVKVQMFGTDQFMLVCILDTDLKASEYVHSGSEPEEPLPALNALYPYNPDLGRTAIWNLPLELADGKIATIR